MPAWVLEIKEILSNKMIIKDFQFGCFGTGETA